ncbi:MAG TPA: caspase family protein [Mycobacteriales bacterium]|nr:caspase family protein [Mycobacteriales bacterium]
MPPGGRYGLVIASSEYADPALARLGAPVHDARALAEVLGDPAVGGFAVQTLVDRPHYEVQRAVARFFKDRRRDDLLLLYFSGHGLKDDAGRLFLATPDTEAQLPDATAVPAAFVRDAMDRARSRCNVLVLDCCYSGAFAHGAKGDDALHTRDGFAASGSVVLTASDAVEYSFEEPGSAPGGVAGGAATGAGSVFTRILVDGLASGAADRDGDGDVSLDELYDYVHDRMLVERPDQRPGKWAWDVRGRILVARNPGWTLPNRLREAIGSPLPGFRLAAIEELGQLLRTGNATVAAVVRDTLAQLADDDSRKVSQAATALLDAQAEPAEPSQAEPIEPGQAEPVGPIPAVPAEPVQAEPVGPGRAEPVEPIPAVPAEPVQAEPAGAAPRARRAAKAATAAARAEHRAVLSAGIERFAKLDGTLYGEQTTLLLEKVTGAGQMIGMCRCRHRNDGIRHTILVLNTDYLIWARETFFSKTTGALIPWHTVDRVTDFAEYGIDIRQQDGTRVVFDSFAGKGLPLRDEPVKFDVKSVRALIRQLVQAAGDG